MQAQLHTSARDERQPRKKLSIGVSVWVILGFILWVGFFIGAVIMHAMVH